MSGVAPFYLLSRSDEQYRQVKDRFNRKWSRSDGPPPRIENIFHVDEAEFRASHRGQRWNSGYDSVEAVLMKDGGMTNHHEAVVYRDDAIVPVGVITYMK
ncbi:unnamed protein product [Fusarium graminearum]|nr:unnamed protein product [Fusarium graminearum]